MPARPDRLGRGDLALLTVGIPRCGDAACRRLPGMPLRYPLCHSGLGGTGGVCLACQANAPSWKPWWWPGSELAGAARLRAVRLAAVVGPAATAVRVDPGAAAQHVAAGSALQGVVPGAAQQDVVAGEALERVGATPATDDVCSGGAAQHVRAGRTGNGAGGLRPDRLP